MLSEDVLRFRFASAERYLKELEQVLLNDWEGAYARWLTTGDLQNGLALVHPAHVSELVTPQQLQGPRRFAPAPLSQEARCQSDYLWGYACPLLNASAYQFDHVFPYTLGGPTAASNGLWLCRLHNQLKSSDVHVFPWERGMPAWLPSQLEAIQNVRRRL